MKTLIVLRHAKTESSHPGGDHNRALTARGKRDAAASAESLVEQGLSPDLILSSTAVRAVQTAEIAAEAFQAAPRLLQDHDIYLASAETILEVVHILDPGVDVVVLVGHNPGLLDFINLLIDEGSGRESLPTSAYAVVESDGARWEDISPGSARVSPIVIP